MIHSGGILPFRLKNNKLEVMLVHPGGPFWARKDEGAWSMPKGLFEEHESSLDAARREFREETGFDVEGEFIPLGVLRQPSRKIVHAWALQRDLDETRVVSNLFSLEWPRRSGIINEYPEIDKAAWFDIDQAKRRSRKGRRHSSTDSRRLSAIRPKRKASRVARNAVVSSREPASLGTRERAGPCKSLLSVRIE